MANASPPLTDEMITEVEPRSALDAIRRELSLVLAAELHALRPSFASDPIRAVALDLHPWHRMLEISILTARDVLADPELLRDDEQAAWSGFHASARDGEGLSKHRLSLALGDRWDRAQGSDERRAVFMAAARALGSETVRAELAGWPADGDVALFVSDPDDPSCVNLVEPLGRR